MGALRACVGCLVVAACGDATVATPPIGGHGGSDSGEVAPPAPHAWQPEVCGAEQWTTAVPPNPAVAISVVKTPDGGATIFSVPEAGGTIVAFAIDDRMDAIGTAKKIPLAENFTAVSGSAVAGRLVTAARDQNIVRVDLLDSDYNPTELAKLDGYLVPEPALFETDGARIVPYAGGNGLMLQVFDSGWNKTSLAQLVPSAPATGIAATQFGQATLIAMSTASDCYLQMLVTTSGGSASHLTYPCANPRLAANISPGMAGMVFEGDGGVRFINLSHTQMGGASMLLRPDATAPRIVFDGRQYWVSYLDARGQLDVGFIDDNNHLVSTAVYDVFPVQQAHALVMIGGAPWAISLDASGYAAHKLCIVDAQ